MLQAENVREAAWGCQWVGTPVPFVRSLTFIINMANKEILLTAGKFVPVSKATMMNVRYYFRCCCKPVEGLFKLPASVCMKTCEYLNRYLGIYCPDVLILFINTFNFLRYT